MVLLGLTITCGRVGLGMRFCVISSARSDSQQFSQLPEIRILIYTYSYVELMCFVHAHVLHQVLCMFSACCTGCGCVDISCMFLTCAYTQLF